MHPFLDFPVKFGKQVGRNFKDRAQCWITYITYITYILPPAPSALSPRKKSPRLALCARRRADVPANLRDTARHTHRNPCEDKHLPGDDGSLIRLSDPPKKHMLSAMKADEIPPDTPEMPGEPATAPSRKSRGKARLLTLDALDRRTLAARRAHELIEAIEADLGGAANLSEGTRQLVQRAAVLGTFVESCEARWLGGQSIELADYLAAVNNQRRVLATIGIERRARDITRREIEDREAGLIG
jgi:hypothetical protein